MERKNAGSELSGEAPIKSRTKSKGPPKRALAEVLEEVQAGWMLEACLPLGPVVTSKLTR